MDIQESLALAVTQVFQESLDTLEFLVYQDGVVLQVPQALVVSPDIPVSKVYLDIQELKELADSVEIRVTLDLKELQDIPESKERLVILERRA